MKKLILFCLLVSLNSFAAAGNVQSTLSGFLGAIGDAAYEHEGAFYFTQDFWIDGSLKEQCEVVSAKEVVNYLNDFDWVLEYGWMSEADWNDGIAAFAEVVGDSDYWRCQTTTSVPYYYVTYTSFISRGSNFRIQFEFAVED